MDDLTFLQKQVIEHPIITFIIIGLFVIFALIIDNREDIFKNRKK